MDEKPPLQLNNGNQTQLFQIKRCNYVLSIGFINSTLKIEQEAKVYWQIGLTGGMVPMRYPQVSLKVVTSYPDKVIDVRKRKELRSKQSRVYPDKRA